MSLEDFRTSELAWLSELHDRAKQRGFSLRTKYVSRQSWAFEIEAQETFSLGKLHHSRKEQRDNPKIPVNCSEEQTWIDEDAPEVVDVFSVIVDHRSPGEYQPEEDNFIVLSEELLGELPDSGKKEIRITSSGCVHPYDKHLNSWGRLFENLS